MRRGAQASVRPPPRGGRGFASLQALYEAARATGRRRRITVAGGHDLSAIEACHAGLQGGLIATATLVGDASEIERLFASAGIERTGFEVIDASDSATILEVALGRFAQGEADVLMKGRVPTGQLLRAVLERRHGLRTGRVLSQIGVFDYLKRLVLVTDCGVNVDPGLTRKADIVRNAVLVAERLGIAVPRVAMLAAVETIHLQAMPATRDAIILQRMNERGELDGCVVEGPLSLDLALVPGAAAAKGVGGQVAGRADIIVADDIEMGNVLYKAIAVMQGLPMASVLVGCRVPVILPSRADTPENKLYSVALSTLLIEDHDA